VSIFQVAGTDATTEDIIAVEERWKKKLQSNLPQTANASHRQFFASADYQQN